MILSSVELSHLRNIGSAALNLHGGVNLLVGPNGSGKTTILEAIHCLSTGRSFRSPNLDLLIQHGAADCLVRGELNRDGLKHRLAVQRMRGGDRRIRLDGEDVQRASELAALLPLLVLHPGTVDLVQGPPDLRRRFMNWGLFHVKPGFQDTWQGANRSLRQRNRALRENRPDAELETWTATLIGYAEQIDTDRQSYMASLEAAFSDLVRDHGRLEDVVLSYQRGWSKDEELGEIYRRDAEKDRERGFTARGFHRADVKISVSGAPADQVCSRGELKLLAWLLTIAQGQLAEHGLVYLVDDPLAELDQSILLELGELMALSAEQLVVTGTHLGSLAQVWPTREQRVFHVEHGTVKEH